MSGLSRYCLAIGLRSPGVGGSHRGRLTPATGQGRQQLVPLGEGSQQRVPFHLEGLNFLLELEHAPDGGKRHALVGELCERSCAGDQDGGRHTC
jgi:hypothetical protein